MSCRIQFRRIPAISHIRKGIARADNPVPCQIFEWVLIIPARAEQDIFDGLFSERFGLRKRRDLFPQCLVSLQHSTLLCTSIELQMHNPGK